MSRRLGLVTLVVALFAAPGLAQEPESGEPDDGLPAFWNRVWELSADIESSYLFGGDLDGPGRNVDVWENRIGLAATGPLWYGSQLTLDLGYEHRLYDFEGSSQLFPGVGDPFDHVQTVRFGATLFQGLSREWGVLLRTGVSLSSEIGADLTDSATVRILAGVGYQFSPSFRLGVGVGVVSRFERDVIAFPGLQLQWDIDDDWRFSIEGPGARLAWTPRDDTTLSLGVSVNFRRYRLDDGAPTFAGIAEDFRLPLGLAVVHDIDDDVRVELNLGVDLYRQLRAEDADGGFIRDLSTDTGIFVGFALTYTF